MELIERDKAGVVSSLQTIDKMTGIPSDKNREGWNLRLRRRYDNNNGDI